MLERMQGCLSLKEDRESRLSWSSDIQNNKIYLLVSNSYIILIDVLLLYMYNITSAEKKSLKLSKLLRV